ncbi:MAG: GMC family oxidoreductase [Telluria sp.]
MTTAFTYDYVIVGGGTAGSVLAARLSEDPALRVLLVEAGPDYADPADVPPALLDPNVPVMAGHNWDLHAVRRNEGVGAKLAQLGRVAKIFEAASGKLAMARAAPALLAGSGDTLNRMAYPMGKVMGGGSAVNGALALHARAEDFEEWEAEGNEFWSWDEVEHWIARLARGGDGQPGFPVETPALDALTPLQSAFAQACRQLGLDAGLTPLPKSTRGGRRMSTAAAYLPAARERANLTILPRCHASRLQLARSGADLRAEGLEVEIDGETRRIQARQFVLAAGAIHTPGLLMRSGVGPAEELRRLGIEVKADRPGVGAGLQDHPVVSLWGEPAAGACAPGEAIHQLMLEARSERSPYPDLQLLMLSAVPTAMFPPLDQFVGAPLASGITVMLSKPRARGQVTLQSADPKQAPRICLNLLEHEADLRRMKEGVRLAWRILREPVLAATQQRGVLWNDAIMESDAKLENAILTTVRAAWHATGTARMGEARDPLAVADQYGALHGCANVWLADASLMPSIPGVPTNLTCVLIAERIAAVLASREAVQRRAA